MDTDMNRAELLLQMVEKAINPDKDYNKNIFVKTGDDSGYYNSDGEHVLPTHNVLSEEANKRLRPTDQKTKKAKAAIEYSGAGYRNMNNVLRHGKVALDDPDYITKEQSEEHIKHLKTLTKHPTQHEFYAYRGMDMKKAGLEKAKIGTIFQDHGFTSVSIRPETATYFGKSMRSEEKGKRNFRIHIKPGTKGHYLSAHNHMGGKGYAGEAEFALHPGTKFRIGKTHRDIRGQRFTDLHIHSQED